MRPLRLCIFSIESLISGRHLKPPAGSTQASTGLMPLALARLGHCRDVGHGAVFVVGPGIFGYVVGACADNHDFGVERKHVLAETQQHLVGCLPRDATAHYVGVGCKQVGVALRPHVGNRVAHQHNSWIGRCGHDAVVGGRRSARIVPIWRHLRRAGSILL